MVNTKILLKPFDFLEERLNKKIVVMLKAYKEYSIIGRLISFDMHLNLVLLVTEDKKEVLKFVRGDHIILIDGEN